MMVTPRMWLAVPGVAALLACVDRAGDSRASVVVRDSLGVRIVENARPQWTGAAAWTVASTPVVDIPRAGDSLAVLTRPRTGVRLTDGRIVLADEGDGQLKVFDADGHWLTGVGRSGEGPGEFRALWWVRRRPGDSVLAYDVALQRFSFYDPALNLVRSYRLRPSPGVPTPSALDVFADGTPLVLGSLFGLGGVRQAGVSREERGLYRYSLAADTYHSVDVTVHRQWYRARYGPKGDGLLAIPVPFATTVDVTPWRNGMVAGSTAKSEWRFIGADGSTEAIYRITHPVQSVTRADRAAAYELLHGRSAKPAIQRAVANAWDDLPRPRHLPAFGRWAWERVPSADPDRLSMLADAVGNLWILRYAPPGEPREWDVLDPTGRWLGAVSLPEGFEPWEIGDGHVLGWRRIGDSGLIKVELYELVKPDG